MYSLPQLQAFICSILITDAAASALAARGNTNNPNCGTGYAGIGNFAYAGDCKYSGLGWYNCANGNQVRKYLSTGSILNLSFLVLVPTFYLTLTTILPFHILRLR